MGDYVISRREMAISSSAAPLSRSSRSQSRSPTSSTSRRRSVPRSLEPPGCSPGTTFTPAGGRQSVQPMDLAGSPTSLGACSVTPAPCITTATTTTTTGDISNELSQYIGQRFDASSSLNDDEALAITHQLKEIQRMRYIHVYTYTVAILLYWFVFFTSALLHWVVFYMLPWVHIPDRRKPLFNRWQDNAYCKHIHYHVTCIPLF